MTTIIIKMDTDHDKIIRLEEKSDALKKVVYEIKDNHLVHLADDVKSIANKVDSINVKMGMWSGGIVVALWVLEKFIK